MHIWIVGLLVHVVTYPRYFRKIGFNFFSSDVYILNINMKLYPGYQWQKLYLGYIVVGIVSPNSLLQGGRGLVSPTVVSVYTQLSSISWASNTPLQATAVTEQLCANVICDLLPSLPFSMGYFFKYNPPHQNQLSFLGSNILLWLSYALNQLNPVCFVDQTIFDFGPHPT